MEELYQVLQWYRTEDRAATICKIKSVLDNNGFLDMFIITINGLLVSEDPGKAEKIEAIIVQAGCNHLLEAGIEVDYDQVIKMPIILLEILNAIEGEMDSWEDYESLYDMIATESVYGLCNLIATVNGNMEIARYFDVIQNVEERVYETIISYVNYRMSKVEDDEPQRMSGKRIRLIREFCKRYPQNVLASIYVSAGVDYSDDTLLSRIDYEYEEQAPQNFYNNIADCIVGLVIRRADYYVDGYEHIAVYAELLIESDSAKDVLAVSRLTADKLKSIYDKVESDEQV